MMKKLIVFLLISHLPLFSLSTLAKTEILDYIVAVVNDDVIVNSTLQEEIQLVTNEWRQKNRRLPQGKSLEKQVLDRLILNTLQLQLAERTGIKVETSLLNEQLRQIAAQNGETLQSFRRKLEKEGYSYKQFRKKIRNQLILRRLQKRQVVNRITITAREIDNFLANQVQQGTVNQEYHLLHILLATPSTPSPAKIKAKLQEAKEVLKKLQQGADFRTVAVDVSEGRQALEGGDLGWLKAGELPTIFSRIVNQMTPGEIRGPFRDASGFHIIKLLEKKGGKQSIITQTQARHILIKTSALMSDLDAKSRLEGLKYRIEQGDDFAELAKAYSEDMVSAANGGSLGWVSPGDLVSEFEEVMNSLSENQVSKPFKSRYGWHIIQVLKRRKHNNTTKALRNKATQQIHQRKVEEELRNWLRQLRDEAYVEYRILH
jgi:peptidyl-prolyl cis-trans isomerase SurA